MRLYPCSKLQTNIIQELLTRTHTNKCNVLNAMQGVNTNQLFWCANLKKKLFKVWNCEFVIKLKFPEKLSYFYEYFCMCIICVCVCVWEREREREREREKKKEYVCVCAYMCVSMCVCMCVCVCVCIYTYY